MKIVFFGTPEFVLPILTLLHKEYNSPRERNLIAVVTQNPKPVGRDKKTEYSPVDKFGFDHKIPVFYSGEEAPEADLAICASYGKIIKDIVIEKYKLGILNVHPSLLPKYRGASPIQAQILSSEEKIGVSIIKMDRELDHGPIVGSFKDTLLEDDTNETLRARLFAKSADFLLALLPSYVSGKMTLKEQNHEEATFTKLITKEDGYLNPSQLEKLLEGKSVNENFVSHFMDEREFEFDANFVCRLAKALDPWPGIWTNIKIDDEEKRLKIKKTRNLDGRLLLDEVQLEGKNTVSWQQFVQGYPTFSFK